MSQVMNQHVQKALKENNSKHDSWSLYFDKFSGYSTKKETILTKIINTYDKPTSKQFINNGILKKYQLFKNLEKNKTMRFIYLENRTRLLVNMGHSCVLENVGFSFERISGIPYIPGSALKGVVSNWALWDANGDAAFEENVPNFSEKRSELNQNLVDIFGSNDDKDAKQGKINFYGIFPLEVPKLEIDILTPHQRGKVIPNHFMTVAAGTKWMIPIALNRGDESLLDKASSIIETCLKNYGVGAKTASGYGKFDTPIKKNLDAILNDFNEQERIIVQKRKNAEEATKKAKEAAQKAAKEAEEEERRRRGLTIEEQAFEDFENSIKNDGDFKGKVAKIADLSEQEQQFICRLLKGKYNHIWAESLKAFAKGKKQNEKKQAKNKGYKRAKAVMNIAKKLGVEL